MRIGKILDYGHDVRLVIGFIADTLAWQANDWISSAGFRMLKRSMKHDDITHHSIGDKHYRVSIEELREGR